MKGGFATKYGGEPRTELAKDGRFLLTVLLTYFGKDRQMKKRLWIMILMVVLLAFVVSCEGLYEQVADTNSSLSQAMEMAEGAGKLAGGAGAAAGVAGIPWGWIVSTLGAVLTTLVGIYKNYQKTIKIGEGEVKYENIENTTRAIVRAIEEVSAIETKDDKTVGDIVKDTVKKNLSDKDIYKIGKAIIFGLKPELK